MYMYMYVQHVYVFYAALVFSQYDYQILCLQRAIIYQKMTCVD